MCGIIPKQVFKRYMGVKKSGLLVSGFPPNNGLARTHVPFIRTRVPVLADI